MDEGYEIALGACFGCKESFMFNPYKVPSYRYKGRREPICAVCMADANRLRVERGEEPHPIAPDAYEPTPTRCGPLD